MLKNLPRDAVMWGLAGAAFLAVAVARLPLPLVLAALAPASWLLQGRERP